MPNLRQKPLARLLAACTAIAFALAPAAGWADCTVSPTTIVHTQGQVGARHTIILDPKVSPLALCNDGTPGAYAFRPGFGDGVKRWVIWLHGGGFCYDQASCAKVYGTPRTTSRYYRLGGQVGIGDGIQSSDPTHNPYFYDANLVVIAYCSSDLWTGGTDGDPSYPPRDVRSWHFRGRDIIKGVIQDLVANRGLASGDEVLYGGGSSGGFAVYQTVNDVVQALPPDTRLLAVSDAGYMIDAQGYSKSAPGGINPATPTPGEAIIQLGSALWGGRGDANCTALATTAAAAQQCYNPVNLTQNGYLPTPIFIRQSYEDRELIHFDGVLLKNGTTTQPNGESYVQYWSATMQQAMAGVDDWHSVYGLDDSNHITMENSLFYTLRSSFTDSSGQGFTTQIDDALGRWYQLPCPSTQDLQPVSE